MYWSTHHQWGLHFGPCGCMYVPRYISTDVAVLRKIPLIPVGHCRGGDDNVLLYQVSYNMVQYESSPHHGANVLTPCRLHAARYFWYTPSCPFCPSAFCLLPTHTATRPHLTQYSTYQTEPVSYGNRTKRRKWMEIIPSHLEAQVFYLFWFSDINPISNAANIDSRPFWHLAMTAPYHGTLKHQIYSNRFVI